MHRIQVVTTEHEAKGPHPVEVACILKTIKLEVKKFFDLMLSAQLITLSWWISCSYDHRGFFPYFKGSSIYIVGFA